MKFTNIHTVYKGKGEKSNLENTRGIFIVNVFRSILLKMVYKYEYENVAPNISESNIGGQKKKRIENNIFILNGIINEAVQKKINIDIQILDYTQCFDSLSLEECLNDLYDANLTNDNLSLIHLMNKENKVTIKTPFGNTKREKVERIICQGEVFSSLICSVHVGSIGKQCIKENKLLYTYRKELPMNSVKIPPLGMVDDIAAVSMCGSESVEMNAFFNTKTNLKKLQFGVSKCKKMHVGENTTDCPQLFIDKWKLTPVDKISYNIEDYVDTEDGDIEMQATDHEKYLGMEISKFGNNKDNIKLKVSKGFGAIAEIINILDFLLSLLF